MIIPSKPYLTYDTYVSHFKYPGIVSNVTKKPENKTVGILATGPMNGNRTMLVEHFELFRAKSWSVGEQSQYQPIKTPLSTDKPAPMSNPKLCDTNDVKTQMHTNIDNR